MKKLSLYLLAFLYLSAAPVFGQGLRSQIDELKNTYAASGTIVMVDDHTLVIEPKMPGPICGLPKNDGGKTTWSFFSFPLASITVPLNVVDEGLVTEDIVFTNPDATESYKPGDVGDTTMIVIAGVPGKEFHTLMYDRDKLAQLGPGPHSSSEYGEAPDDVIAFGLTFKDHEAARAFESALKDAVMMAKAKMAHPDGQGSSPTPGSE